MRVTFIFFRFSKAKPSDYGHLQIKLLAHTNLITGADILPAKPTFISDKKYFFS